MSKGKPYTGDAPQDAHDRTHDKSHPNWGILTGRNKLAVLRSLATGDRTKAQIARDYGVHRATVVLFARRHARDIDEMRDRLDDEFAGLWIVQKRARLAEIEWQLEIIDSSIKDLAEQGQYDMDLMRVKASLMKQASEELGQLPPRQQVVSAHVTHVVEGFSTDELKDMLT